MPSFKALFLTAAVAFSAFASSAAVPVRPAVDTLSVRSPAIADGNALKRTIDFNLEARQDDSGGNSGGPQQLPGGGSITTSISEDNPPTESFTYTIKSYTVQGSIDLSTLAVDVKISASVPIGGPVTLASGQGNLKDGVSFTFDRFPLASGKAMLYLKDKYVWLSLDVSGTAGNIKQDGKLFSLPF